MDELSDLLSLIETFKEALNRAEPAKRNEAIKKAATALKGCMNLLTGAPRKPTQKELKQELLLNRTASRIRELWEKHKGLINLRAMCAEVGITLKNPTMDHLIIAYYFPSDLLNKLADRFETIAANDTGTIETQRFQDWRGRLRALTTREAVQSGVESLIQQEGVDSVKSFAVHLNAKDSSGTRKLPKNASAAKLVEAVAAQLWKERVVSLAQEGTL